jgi:hypothetical protein
MMANLNITVIYLGTVVIYSGTLTLKNVGTAVNCLSIFMKLAPGPIVVKNYGGNLLMFVTG